MRLAIMQPYFFPYLGYWQLIRSADRLVILDDVSFIKRGWINRNRILINGEPSYITIPLVGASQNKRICDISMQSPEHWRRKMLKSIEQSYRNSACFEPMFGEIDRLIRHETSDLSDYLANQLRGIARLLDMDTDIVVTSRIYCNEALKGHERILDICRREGATTYINLPGGQELYDPAYFEEADTALCFIAPRISPYQQGSENFVPNLSLIDALLEIGKEGVMQRLDEFDVIAPNGGSLLAEVIN